MLLKKWIQVFGFFAGTWKMISWSCPSKLLHYYFASILKDVGCPNWVRKGEKKSTRIWDQSTYTIGENAFSLWLWKISFSRDPLPPDFGVWHMVWATDGRAVIQLLRVWHPRAPPCSTPAGRQQPELGDRADSAQLLRTRKERTVVAHQCSF